jgi:hypothetical protein
MITKQHKQEQLSRAYINAVVAHAGHKFQPATELDYGVDGCVKQIKHSNNRRYESGYGFDVQLKATTTWEIDNNCIVYDLEAKTYNDLARRFTEPRATELILAVLCLPPDESEWLEISQEKLVLKKCCYWCQLKDGPTENETSKRIRIPIVNILSPISIQRILDKVERGDGL